MPKIGKRVIKKYIEEVDRELFKRFDKACGIYHLGNVTKEKLQVFKALLITLQRYGVRRFFIQQSYCNSEYADILRQEIPNADITAVTHYHTQTEEDELVIDKMYAGLCARRINIVPESRRISAVNWQVVSYILANTDFGICSMEQDDLVTRRIKKSSNLAFDLNCRSITEINDDPSKK